MTVLVDQSKPTYDQLLAMYLALRADKATELRLEFNDKPYVDKMGKTHPATYSISIWGLTGRKPVTMSARNWQRLADYMPTVLEFVAAHPAPANGATR